MSDSKPWYLSKIFWLNVAWVLVQVLAQLPGWIGNPDFEPLPIVVSLVSLIVPLLTAIFRLFFTNKTLNS